LKYSSVVVFLFPQKVCRQLSCSLFYRPSRTFARRVLCSSSGILLSLFFRSEWQSLLTEELFGLEHFAMSFRLQEKFVERCFQ
jgi:hypothetical protein